MKKVYKVGLVIDRIIEMFKTNKVPKALAFHTFPPVNVPMNKWSYLNRMLAFYAKTIDGRGIKQWNKQGRQVKKGAKAFYIFAPRFKKVVKEEDKEDYRLAGFLLVPVFRVEDTIGKPLNYELPKLPTLPLQEVAKAWGISLKAVPKNDKWLGVYRPDSKEIVLASKDEIVFFHELAHASHDLIGGFQRTANWEQEIIAEFSAAVLAYLTGCEPNIGACYNYIAGYCQKENKAISRTCMRLVAEIEKVVVNIINTAF